MITVVLCSLLIATLSIQIIYLLLIFTRVSFFKQKMLKTSALENSKEEGVSVLIVAHNERENLKTLVPALFNQAYGNYEVMVINDRSNDGTRQLLEEFSAVYPNFRTVTVKSTPDHVHPKKYALTLGVKVAAFDILLLTDADCLPASNNWIEKMSAPLRNEGKDFALGHAPYKKESSLLNQWIQYETLWTTLLSFSFALWKAPILGVGRNLCYRKSLFLSKKAFHGLWDIIGGDDDLFVNKYATGKNTAVVIDPESCTLSHPKTTWGSYSTQKKRHLHVGKYYKWIDKFKIGWYSLSHLVFWVVSLLILFFLGIENNWEHFLYIIGIIIVRMIFLTIVINGASKKLEGISRFWFTPIFDVLYIGYFWIMGTISFLTKTVKWN
jgi:glycosyltransferase involved in cell wall biosynthesis